LLFSNFNDASTQQIEGNSVDTSDMEMTFTTEQEELFARRLEEYDLYDLEYVRWLRKNHPEVNYGPTESESITE